MGWVPLERAEWPVMPLALTRAAVRCLMSYWGGEGGVEGGRGRERGDVYLLEQIVELGRREHVVGHCVVDDGVHAVDVLQPADEAHLCAGHATEAVAEGGGGD